MTVLINAMNQSDYTFYNTKLFRKIAPFYDIIELFLGNTRSDIVKKAKLPVKSKVLDIACGTGSLSIAFAKQGHIVTGVDLSLEMLARALKKSVKKPYFKLKFIEHDAKKLPFPDNSFDATSISLGLHEMPNEIRSKVLSEMVRVTKHNGKIIIFDYNNESRGTSDFFLKKIIKIPESKYYGNFINAPMSDILQNKPLKLVKSKEFFKGIFKLWIYRDIK